jgi:predicted enzyme related to lactoylglutathione lyase
MLQLNSIILGTKDVKKLAEFYEKVFERKADMAENDWYGWKVGSVFFSFGPHSEVAESAKEPQRMMFNFDTQEVEKEFDRIKALGATVIKDPYEMGGMHIATLADPDGNFFQLVTPWEEK